MTPPRHDGGAVRLSDHELEAMLARAAEEGARRALSDVGLGGKDAVLTIHDMRSLLGVHPVRPPHRGADRRARHHHRRADRAPDRHRHEAALVRAEPVIRACACAPLRMSGGAAACAADSAFRRTPDATSASGASATRIIWPRRRLQTLEHRGALKQGRRA